MCQRSSSSGKIVLLEAYFKYRLLLLFIATTYISSEECVLQWYLVTGFQECTAS